MSKRWFLPVSLIALFSTSGWVWGQTSYTFKEEPEKPFLQPYSPERKNQSLDASYKTNIIDTNKKYIDKTSNKPISAATQKSSKSTLRQHQKSEVRPNSPKIGDKGSVLSFQGYNQNRTTGSGSFLDGYLLKSLQDKPIVKKKAADERSSDETILKKKKGTFIK